MSIRVYTIFPTVFLLLIVVKTQAQYKLDSKIFSAIGYEYNPYESPDRYYSTKEQVEFSRLELIKSDPFVEYGYEFALTRKFKRKFSVEFTSNWQNKKFLRENILNSGKFNIGLAPSLRINKWLTIGARYEFEKRADVDADILGDQTRYVFSYIQHGGTVFFRTKPWKKNITNIYYTLDQKQYDPAYTNYSGGGNIPDEIYLDNIQHTLDLRLIQGLKKRSSLAVKIVAFDRKYSYLHSYDSLLSPNDLFMRHYQDIMGKLTFSFRVNNSLEIKQYVNFERRNDVFNDYYSFNKYEGGLGADLSFGKFGFKLDGWYELFDYDKYEAPIDTRPYPTLQYQYFNGKIELVYKAANGFDIAFTGYNELRKSNASLITWKYRRGYENFFFKLGVVVYPDKWIKNSKGQ